MSPAAAVVLGAALGAAVGSHQPALTNAVVLERHRRELMAWNAAPRRRYSPDAAAFYRELRLAAKRRSRARGHGAG